METGARCVCSLYNQFLINTANKDNDDDVNCDDDIIDDDDDIIDDDDDDNDDDDHWCALSTTNF